MERTTRTSTAAAAALLLSIDVAAAQGWPEIYDPLVLRTLHLEMSDADWQTIQNDETFDIWVPTLLWLDGEEPILVAIRRKSADPLDHAPGYSKVSYKIDVNEYVSGQNWHGLRAVSLDNGDDENVVSEGLAWYLHRVASGPAGYGYDAGKASWVRLVVNDVDTGVYVSAEQRDKRFLEHRGLWIEDETWLYEVEDIQGQELDEGGPEDSPLLQSLCYSPFASPSTCSTPDAATLAAELPQVIDMRGLLSLAAVDAFSANPDAIFSHGKNFYFADYLQGQLRHYFPWDLDSSLSGGGVNHDVYAPQSHYAEILLAVPEFRELYSQILNDLVCGPFREAELHAFLDALEPVLTDALEADPNSQIDGSVAEYFASRKAWLSARLAAVASQIEGFVPCSDPCDPNITTYCVGAANSAGPGARIAHTGTTSIAQNDFTVRVTGVVPNQFGIFFYGGTETQIPFGDGFRCVGSPIFRLNPPQLVDASGESSRLVDFTAPPAGSGAGKIEPGSTWKFQHWYRDPGFGGSGFNLSDALSATFCP